jgi:signal transduction histidine kinase
LDLSVSTDWKCYELILFNLIQNAIKYNKPNGDIAIVHNLKPLNKKTFLIKSNYTDFLECNESKKNSGEENKKYVLETLILDTGVGISKT